MARASYIYLALDGVTPVGAFTVKHELIKWLAGNPGRADGVLRLPDGERGGADGRFMMRGVDISHTPEILGPLGSLRT